MKLGVSAYPDTNDSLEVAYPKQVASDHAKGCYYYGQSAPTWTPVATIDPTHAIAFQTKGTSRSSYDATLKTFPASRSTAGSAYVFFHPVNEIDRHVKEGVLTLAQAEAQIDAIVAAAKASGKTYVIPAVGLMYYCLDNYNHGIAGPNDAWNFPAYIRPGVKRILLSVYANGHASGGDWTPNGPIEDPTKIAPAVDKMLDAHPGVSWTAVLGYPIPPAYINDAGSLNDRVAWLQASFDAYKAMRHPPSHLLWFDQNWGPLGDERLSEPKLHDRWVKLAQSVGQ